MVIMPAMSITVFLLALYYVKLIECRTRKAEGVRGRESEIRSRQYLLRSSNFTKYNV